MTDWNRFNQLCDFNPSFMEIFKNSFQTKLQFEKISPDSCVSRLIHVDITCMYFYLIIKLIVKFSQLEKTLLKL